MLIVVEGKTVNLVCFSIASSCIQADHFEFVAPNKCVCAASQITLVHGTTTNNASIYCQYTIDGEKTRFLTAITWQFLPHPNPNLPSLKWTRWLVYYLDMLLNFGQAEQKTWTYLLSSSDGGPSTQPLSKMKMGGLWKRKRIVPKISWFGRRKNKTPIMQWRSRNCESKWLKCGLGLIISGALLPNFAWRTIWMTPFIQILKYKSSFLKLNY